MVGGASAPPHGTEARSGRNRGHGLKITRLVMVTPVCRRSALEIGAYAWILSARNEFFSAASSRRQTHAGIPKKI